MAGIAVRKLLKSFGAVRVIDDVSLEIDSGTFLALVGPSGCGKSTLLRLIAGLEEVHAGQICIGARDVTHLPPKERDIAMVFQNYALYPHMTVLQNMGFSLRLAGAGAQALRAAVTPVAEILGLADLLDRYPRQLSGGQRQRVAMGRAIVRKPEVFLFDEPLSNLDAKLRVAMRTEIKALHQRLRNTIVYVTHDQVEAMTMADRIAVMDAGRVAQIGTPLELFDDPANRFVAGFIGSPAMNFLPGRITSGRVEFAGAGHLPISPGFAVIEGREVHCGIRPHHVELAPQGIAATVEVVEPTGTETLVHARIGPVLATLAFRERLAARSGDRLTVAAAPGNVLLFDPETGARLRPGQS